MLNSKKQFLFFGLLFAVVFVLIFGGGATFAHHPDAAGDSQNLSAQTIQFKDPITPEFLEQSLFNITCWSYRVGSLLLIIFIVWTAIKMMSAGPSAERFSKAKSAFGYVLIGGLVFFGVGVIISTIAYALGVEFIFLPACF